MSRVFKALCFQVGVIFLLSKASFGQDVTHPIRIGGDIWFVQYGVTDEKLSYLVIDGPQPKALKLRVQLIGVGNYTPTNKTTHGTMNAIFEHPNGEFVNLARTGRVIYVNGEEVKEEKVEIEPDGLKAFLNSKPESLDKETLLNFLAEWKMEETKKPE
ncbi:hypothetical protein [Roseibacillus ishigakijimensis]|uniref:Uncharacterized protein n=1 Tax=Roseibacillus ishigakijimensis TaxID=454146 RepID=A0A934VP22_9BACT|nr:hypothetical protein [Roseibacillus ishigakijimensis]MBK1835640.1 hypothetical protein [Roseibacillus ishigakijimensis]